MSETEPPLSESFFDRRYLVKFLAQSRLFGDLDEAALREVVHRTRLRQYFANEIIVWEGKSSDSLHFILNGIVAVKHIVSADRQHVFAFLMPGNTFGEVGILENRPRSATVAALTNVDALVIQRDDFMELMRSYPDIAIALCRQIARYLTDTNNRLARGNRKSRLVLLFDLFGEKGVSSLGMNLAQKITQATRKSVVYTEFPEPGVGPKSSEDRSDGTTIAHPGGFDVVLSHEDPVMPVHGRTVMMIDYMMVHYDSIIITVRTSPEALLERVDEGVSVLLENAAQAILIGRPEVEAWETMLAVCKKLQEYVPGPEFSVLTLLCNNPDRSSEVVDLLPQADFSYQSSRGLPQLDNLESELVETTKEMDTMLSEMYDRLERQHKVAIYIPTTVDIETVADTGPQTERTLGFLAERFGGATRREARGVWNSKVAGLVSEDVHIVIAHVTQADLNKHMDEIVEYVRQLKSELKQEAMALEIDDHLTLV